MAQADIDAAVAAFTQGTATLTQINGQIAGLGLNTSALPAAVAGFQTALNTLQTTVAAETAATAPVAAPAPVAASATTQATAA